MKRILIVNVNWLGDTLFTTPFIKALRDNYPGSHITVLTHPRCLEILEGNPRVNEIIVYDEKGKHRHLIGKFSIVSRLKAKEFDAAFVLRKSLTRTMILFLSNIPERIGYDSRKAGFLLTKKIPPPRNLHKVEYFLGLARAIGIEPRSCNYEIFISDEDRYKADEILRREGVKGSDFIVMNPGGNWNLKRWPAENFARLGDEIFSRFRKKVILTGAEKDIELCERISGLMEAAQPALLCGKTSLKTLGAVFKKAKWVISNDSGPMHIAVSVKAPVIALFGPTSPSITGPYGDGLYKVLQKELDCDIPCYNESCENNECMKAITVEDVLKAMK